MLFVIFKSAVENHDFIQFEEKGSNLDIIIHRY